MLYLLLHDFDFYEHITLKLLPNGRVLYLQDGREPLSILVKGLNQPVCDLVGFLEEIILGLERILVFGFCQLLL